MEDWTVAVDCRSFSLEVGQTWRAEEQTSPGEQFWPEGRQIGPEGRQAWLEERLSALEGQQTSGAREAPLSALSVRQRCDLSRPEPFGQPRLVGAADLRPGQPAAAEVAFRRWFCPQRGSP
jgi:hypothetical protein